MKKKNENGTLKHRTKSVLDSSAQNVTQCAASSNLVSGISELKEAVDRIRGHNLNLHIFATIQLRAGLRVSELLSVTPGDVDQLGRIKVKGLKGSLDRVVDCGEYCDIVKANAAIGAMPWQGWNRFYIYREYKKYGVTLDVEGNKRKAVTHSLRHESALLLKDESAELSHAQGLLGHKNVTNTEHYVGRKATNIRNKKR